MKNKCKILSLVFIAGAIAACGGNAETKTESNVKETNTEGGSNVTTEIPKGKSGTYLINEAESMVMWEGNMLKIGGVSLYGHNGTIGVKPSKIAVANGDFKKGTLVIDMMAITPTDENYNPEEGGTKEDLIGHLSSPDFFDVQNHPTAKFEVIGLKNGNLIGNMTIRGVTNEEVIENVSVDYTDNQMVATGKMTIDRQKYNVAFKMPAEDKILSDDIDLEFKIVAEMAS